MQAFSIDDLKQRPRSIEDAARREPVTIRDAGEEFVLMTRRAFDALQGAIPKTDILPKAIQAGPYRRAHAVDDLPEDLADELLEGLAQAAKTPYRID
ncbi:hypothetical protein [Prosthecodimorpha staleyi]|uniref:Antitoxin n=1 Tax=Prosthecodimorpha staleyi TaxID=2840188 RepID=A0A947GFG8_9HYPH|nr:hypothetical protein [Prosthecodimorpha staleyi]MBT9290555.1 hypothetical protein [Prosthecodimorpha staleyi]